MSRTLSKFCLPFDEATPFIHFLKALKRPQNNDGPARYNYYTIIMKKRHGMHEMLDEDEHYALGWA